MIPTPWRESPSYDVQMIPIGQIAESPLNPCKTFLDMDDLVEDVKKRGILQPVLVRPLSSDDLRTQSMNAKGYELVFGARRFRAAKAAKLEAVPAMVRELADDEALELMIVENCKRSDIHPLEEADGYRQLHEKHGHDVEDIAAKVGKSKAYVYGRMKLCALEASARKAFVEEKITPSIALLVARTPHDLQAKATKDLTLERWGNPRRPLNKPMSFREATEMLQKEYMLLLSEAPFSKDDPDLVAKAGPCTTCPKRTGNQRELFEDVKSADVCTDPPCFRLKSDAHWERAKAAAQAEGQQVLSDAEAKKALPNGRLRYGNSEFVDLGERCYDDSKQRTYGALLKKAPPVEKILARDEYGKVHELAKRTEASKALKDAGHKFASSSTGASTRLDPQEKKRQARLKLQKKVVRAAVVRISEHAAKAKPDLGLWRLLVVLVEAAIGTTPSKTVLGRWGLDPKGQRWGDKHSEKLLRILHEHAPGEHQARALLVELLVEDRVQYLGGWDAKYPDGLALAAEYFGVDLAQLEKDAAAAAPAKKKAAKKGARKK